MPSHSSTLKVIKLLIKVKPGSSKDEIHVDLQYNISVKIKAKPVDGEANDYLVKYLADEFGISRNSIQLEKGKTSRIKQISIALEQEKFFEILEKFKQ